MAQEPRDGLSIDVGAELAALSGGGSETSDQSAQPTETSVDAAETPASDFFGQSEDDGQQAAVDEQTTPGGKFKFKDDGKEYELDPVKDKEEIIRRLGMFNAGKRAFSEAAKLKQRERQLAKELTEAQTYREKAELIDKLQDLRGNPFQMYKVLTDGGDLREFIKEEALRQIRYSEAGDEERKVMDAEDREKRLRAEMDQMRKEAQAREEKTTRQKYEADKAELRSRAIPYWKAVVNKLNISDSALKQEVANTIWDRAFSKIYDQVEHPGEITNDMLKREILAVGRLMGLSNKQQARAQVTAEIEERKKTAKEQAGVAATRHYQTPDLSKKVGALSPAEAFREMRKGGFFSKRK